MTVLDHLFVLTAPGAPVADRLVEAGWPEGTPNVHPGQGTANRRFFAPGVMLELLWIRDREEAASPRTARTGLLARAEGGAPFGFAVRGGTFATWPYAPAYLPEGVTIPVATDSDDARVPMVFELPFGRRPDAPPRERREVLHDVGELSEVILYGARVGDSLRAIADAGVVRLADGPPHLEVVFEAGRGVTVDLRPEAALVVRW